MISDIRTLYGKAEYCWITEPDTKFDPQGKYHIDLLVKKAEAEQVVKVINDAIGKKIADNFKSKTGGKVEQVKRAPLPFEKKEDGSYIFKIKSKFKPKVWDKDRKELDPNTYIWKDTTMWVQFKLNPYDTTVGIGCSLYMNNIQVDNLVQGSSQNGACPFPKRDGSALPGPEKAVAL